MSEMNQRNSSVTRPANPQAAAASKGKVYVGGKEIAPKKVETTAPDPHRTEEEKNAELIEENKKLRAKIAMTTEKKMHKGIEIELPGAILFGKDQLVMLINKELVNLSDITGETVAELAMRAGLKSDLKKMKEDDLEVVVERLREFVSTQAGAVRTRVRAQIKREDKLNGAY